SMLLELVIATALISFVMTGLMTTIYQLHNSQTRVDRIIEAHDRAALLFHQFEADVTGVFLPVQNSMPQPVRKEEKTAEKNNEVSEISGKPEEKSPEAKPV